MVGAPAALATGAVFENHRVLGLLVAGHLGSSYEVEELESGRRRALELIHPHVVAPGFDATEFDRVLRSGRELDREHYVEVLRTGFRVADSTPWFLTQLLRGEDGAARVRSKGPLAAQLVIEMFDQSCRALQRAHQQREAHGDLKPENFFFASARRVGMPFSINLLDYGVARFVDTGEKLWRAPEQTPGPIQDPRIDVWALGLVGFFMLTGRSFWDAPDAADPTRGDAVIPPAGRAAATLGVPLPYPRAFDTWFSQCVHVDPDARFDNAAAVLKGFRKVLAGVPLDSSARRVHSILGAQSQAVTVPQPERAEPGRPSVPGPIPSSGAMSPEGPSSLPALSGAATFAEPLSQAAPTQLPATRIPATRIPDTQAAATQQVVTHGPRDAQAMGGLDLAMAQTELGTPSPGVRPSAPEIGPAVPPAGARRGALGASLIPAAADMQPLAKGAIGGCAIGALGIAFGAGLLLLVVVVAVVAGWFQLQ